MVDRAVALVHPLLSRSVFEIHLDLDSEIRITPIKKPVKIMSTSYSGSGNRWGVFKERPSIDVHANSLSQLHVALIADEQHNPSVR